MPTGTKTVQDYNSLALTLVDCPKCGKFKDAQERETDSDSDSYVDDEYKPSLADQMTAQTLRSGSSYCAFERADASLASRVKIAIERLVASPESLQARYDLLQLRRELCAAPDPGEIIKTLRRQQYAAAYALYALFACLRLTRRKVYHGKLLLKLLNIFEGKSDSFTEADVEGIVPFTYGNSEAFKACGMALVALKHTDEEFATCCTEGAPPCPHSTSEQPEATIFRLLAKAAPKDRS
jgi:hypothetical protein